ncbi:MAG: SPOCS domain-containing protein [Anaerotignaceae bacterium]
MPFELIKNTNSSIKKTGMETTQILVEGDLIVPDIKPDIAEILKVTANPVIEEEKTAEDRVGFKGNLKLNIIYLAKKSEKPVHSMEDTLPFEDFINMDGVTRLSDVYICAKLTHLEYKLINDRKIGIKAIISITAWECKQVETEVLSDVLGNNLQVKKMDSQIQVATENKKDRIIIHELFNLERSKPEISEMLQCNINLCNIEQKATYGGIDIKGEAIAEVLYIGNTDDSIVEYVELPLQFNGTVESSQVTDDMYPTVHLSVDKVEYFPVTNNDGEDKIIDVEVSIGVLANATKSDTITLVEDVYSIETPVETITENLIVPVTVGHSIAKNNIKEVLTLGKDNLSLMKIIRPWSKCEIDNVTVHEDYVEVNGVITLQLLYIAIDDLRPVEAVEFFIPFEQTIEVLNAQPTDTANVECCVENTAVNILAAKEFEAIVTLILEVDVTREETIHAVTSVVETEKCNSKHIAPVTIYCVQKNDSLWSIAKKYNTTIQDILLVNEIENPDLIYPGQKLLILKRLI